MLPLAAQLQLFPPTPFEKLMIYLVGRTSKDGVCLAGAVEEAGLAAVGRLRAELAAVGRLRAELAAVGFIGRLERTL